MSGTTTEQTLEAPGWFTDALAAPVDVGAVDVDGVSVAYRAWGTPGPGGVVLVHGGAAHSRWWDHVGPLLTDEGTRRVVALDLSGHGDSGRRPHYDGESWAAEILAVAGAAGAGPEPLVIGHSMGGMVTLVAARLFGARLGGAAAIDTPVWERPPEESAANSRRAFGPLRTYPSKAAAIAKFRTVPDQPDPVPAVLAHIAETSVREVEGGWVWKFDPEVFVRRDYSPPDVSSPGCRVALFRAEHGLVPVAMGERTAERIGRAVPIIEIPQAAHHVMIDHPLALVTGLRTLLAAWSVP